MKRSLQFIISAAAVSVMAYTARAEMANPPNTDRGGTNKAADAVHAEDHRPSATNDNGTVKADNTARNTRDRDDATLTPLDQGTSKGDIDITASIRKEVVAGENMSLNGKNVKIITKNGHVTLRGPVNSAEEKHLIGEIAARLAPADKVDNQLEVKDDVSKKE